MPEILGYDKKLYVLAFDHRGSFEKMILGHPPTNDEEAARIRDAKALIAEGFELALERGAPVEYAGILVDEQYGADIARKAKERGWVFAMPAERSGQRIFELEYGEAFGEHIEAFDPTFTKVLVRYNPADDEQDKAVQAERLRMLGDWLHARGRRFLFELLVPPSEDQLASVDGDKDRYDLELRPGLTRDAIVELQDAGVEPDIWKLEGMDRREDCIAIAEVARRDGRDRVGCVVLGRGANKERVAHWLATGAGVPGYLGFAIGRTIWADAVAGHTDGSLDRRAAAELVADNYLWAIDVYEKAEQGA